MFFIVISLYKTTVLYEILQSIYLQIVHTLFADLCNLNKNNILYANQVCKICNIAKEIEERLIRENQNLLKELEGKMNNKPDVRLRSFYQTVSGQTSWVCSQITEGLIVCYVPFCLSG